MEKKFFIVLGLFALVVGACLQVSNAPIGKVRYLKTLRQGGNIVTPATKVLWVAIHEMDEDARAKFEDNISVYEVSSDFERANIAASTARGVSLSQGSEYYVYVDSFGDLTIRPDLDLVPDRWVVIWCLLGLWAFYRAYRAHKNGCPENESLMEMLLRLEDQVIAWVQRN